MLISISHTTRYLYDTPARYAIQTLRLTPPNFVGQTVREWNIAAPGMDKAVHFTDGFGNAAALISTAQTHTEIEITGKGLVETTDCAGVVSGLAELAPTCIYLRKTPATTPDAAITALAANATGADQLALLHDLMRIIRERVAFETGTTTQLTAASEVLAIGTGVCQDHAHVFISAARTLDIPARYVNGYFLSGAEGPEPAHHAWAEAKVEHLGWVGFDIANRICPDDRYVRLATGLDATSASPIRGSRPVPLGTSHVNERLDVIVEVHQQQQQSVQQ